MADGYSIPGWKTSAKNEQEVFYDSDRESDEDL